MRKLKFSVFLGVVLTLCFVLVTFVFAQKGQKGQKGGKPDKGGGYIYVDVTFRDGPLDLIKSDLLGPYSNNIDGVMAIVGVTEGGFRLDTSSGKQVTRMVFLDFSDSVWVDEYPPFGASDFQGIDLRIGEEFDFDNGVWTGTKLDIIEMGYGEDNPSYGELSIDFAPTGQKSRLMYKLIFGKYPWGPDVDHSDPVKVVRNGTNSWTLSAGISDVATLLKFEKQRKAMTITEVGRFRMPFSIDVVEIQ